MKRDLGNLKLDRTHSQRGVDWICLGISYLGGRCSAPCWGFTLGSSQRCNLSSPHPIPLSLTPSSHSDRESRGSPSPSWGTAGKGMASTGMKAVQLCQ